MSETEPAGVSLSAAYWELLELVFMPMLVSAGWWISAFQPWCPPMLAQAPHHDRHELEVPDPVERDGEHALFA